MQGTWLVKDTSTNGSFVNNVRVGKGNEAPLKVNDVLRLSQAVGEKNKLIECAAMAHSKALRRSHTCSQLLRQHQCVYSDLVTAHVDSGSLYLKEGKLSRIPHPGFAEPC